MPFRGFRLQYIPIPDSPSPFDVFVTTDAQPSAIPALICVVWALLTALATLLAFRWQDYGFEHGDDSKNPGPFLLLSSFFPRPYSSGLRASSRQPTSQPRSNSRSEQ